MSWYGENSAWVLPFQREARRYFGDAVQAELRRDCLLYRHEGLDIPGRAELVPVSIEFQAQPTYATYGLPPEDYPRVFADRGLSSPHRMLDDSLCLFFPGDSPERRWSSGHGLLALLIVVADHLFFETYWRHTGGHRRGLWLGPEAPHGFQSEKA